MPGWRPLPQPDHAEAYPQPATVLPYPQTSTSIKPFTYGQAELVFRSGDDLLLNPANGNYPPTQLFSTIAGTTNSRRQFQGDYSWLATVVPGNSTYQANTTNPTYVFTPIGDTNLVRVSIVVFYKRNAFISIDPTGATPPSERMVLVNNTGGASTLNGVSGGEVQMQSPSQSYLNLKAGQWIMLSQQSFCRSTNTQRPPPTQSTCYNDYWYRWYKVVAIGVRRSAGTNTSGQPFYYRNVTLSGPDWNPGTTGSVFPAYASIVDGVVAVYEKEIELEQTGRPGLQINSRQIKMPPKLRASFTANPTNPTASEGRQSRTLAGTCVPARVASGSSGEPAVANPRESPSYDGPREQIGTLCLAV